MLVIADWQPVGGHGREIMAPLGSSVGSFSACCAKSGASGDDDSLFAGHLGVLRTVYRLQNRVYWPGLRDDVRSYLVSCTVCLARKSYAHEGLPWDMSTLVTDGIELQWTCWICR